MQSGVGKAKTQVLCSSSGPEAGGWHTGRATEEPRVLQAAEHDWALRRAGSQHRSHQTCSERKTKHFSTMLVEDSAIILKNGYLSLLST